MSVINAGPDVLRDSWTMLRRNVLQMVRYKSLTLMLVAQPLIFLLLFVYVFGGTMGAGLPGGGGRADYLVFIMPAIVVITVASVSLSTAYTIALDMEKGIIDRFRTMAIAKSAVLTGRVLGAIVMTSMAFVVVMAVAFLLGYRSDGTALGWLGVVGLVLLMTFALTWLTVALGLSAPQRRDGQQQPDAADVPALPVQRLRADRLDARGDPLVRRLPAVHADDQHAAGLDGWRRRRLRRVAGAGLVRRDRGPVLPLGTSAVHQGPGELRGMIETC